MNNRISLAVLSALAFCTMARGEVVRIVHEQRLVPSVSSKTEKGWTRCCWCDGRISYDRTYRWNPYNRVWIETTKRVPETCRKCKSHEREMERLRREESNLDRKIELKEAKSRVAEKRRQLRDWSAARR